MPRIDNADPDWSWSQVSYRMAVTLLVATTLLGIWWIVTGPAEPPVPASAAHACAPAELRIQAGDGSLSDCTSFAAYPQAWQDYARDLTTRCGPGRVVLTPGAVLGGHCEGEI